MTALERRIFRVGTVMVLAGAVVAAVLFGVRHGLSFLAGGLLGGVSLVWLRHTVNAVMLSGGRRPVGGVILGFVLRLLLIPLCLYAMMRFLYVGVIAAVAGFAAFNCSIFVEALYEIFRSSRR